MRNEAFNFHQLFQSPLEKAFIRQLDVDAKTTSVMNDAVSKIRDMLSPALRQLALNAGVPSQYATPRFRMQGSAVYKTQNQPAHIPPQQLDADFGVYIAAAFMDSASNGHAGKKYPAHALAKAYFETVDTILKKLCNREGWKYAEGKKQKDTCCRVDLSPIGVAAHIDVPLYAAPNEQFEKARVLDEKIAKSIQFAEARGNVAPKIDREGWDELTVVVMATRLGEWSESDVQIVIQHFRAASDRFSHPFVLRKVWRYVKSWRDYIWRDGGAPSSVLLMQIVVQIFDADIKASQELLGSGREDRILHHVFTYLGDALAKDVWVQWGTTPENLNTANAQLRTEWTAAANACHKSLDQALFDATLQNKQVINLVRQRFGQRIPDDVTLVTFLAVTAPMAHAATPPKQQQDPQARIHRTTGAK